MKILWGEGLLSCYYFKQRLALRRNSLVYEVRIRFGNFRITFTLFRNPIKEN